MFGKVLIANRGEIAVRITHALRERGIGAVAVYSEPDRAEPHVAAADEAYALGGVTSAETYLRGDAIIAIARACGAEAIHPGYGFLSENAEFAQACADANIAFVGPRPDVIRAMGDKIVAKKTMADAGVPVVPGQDGADGLDATALSECAEAIGFPLLVKAAAGGGGKGMRVVRDLDALTAAVEAAQREAGSAFGDARVFLERYVERARHVEFQIFGDDHGNVVHLFERDCSVQRRYQKIIEEAPAPGLSPELRGRMSDAAVRAAQAIGYTNAGTVEFMVDDRDAFYFLEVNTRLQVEHPVTELTTDTDLVHAQLVVAAGEPLPFSQGDLAQRGHAIECRIYAEDAARDFLPSTGQVMVYEPPAGPGIRVDGGIARGSEVSVHYDPMLAKLIVRAATRDAAIDRMLGALDRFVILGVTTNIDFLRRVLASAPFRAGALHTRFLEEHPLAAADGDVPDEAFIAAALATVTTGALTRGAAGDAPCAGSIPGPWDGSGAWRLADGIGEGVA